MRWMGVDDIWGRNGTPTNATYRRMGRGRGRDRVLIGGVM